jgi:hypothetical protein
MKEAVFSGSDHAPPIYIANGFLQTWSRVFFHPSTGVITGHTERPGDETVLLISATNGDASQMRVSHKEHEVVFDGEEPQIVLKAVIVDDWQLTGGQTDFSKSLKDSLGVSYVLSTVGFEALPHIVSKNSDANFVVTLRGDSMLRAARLEGIQVNLEGGVKANPISDTVSLEGDIIARRIGFRLRTSE